MLTNYYRYASVLLYICNLSPDVPQVKARNSDGKFSPIWSAPVILVGESSQHISFSDCVYALHFIFFAYTIVMCAYDICVMGSKLIC